MKIVIPSKDRANILLGKALRLFPDATVCVGDDEGDINAKVSSNLQVHLVSAAANATSWR